MTWGREGSDYGHLGWRLLHKVGVLEGKVVREDVLCARARRGRGGGGRGGGRRGGRGAAKHQRAQVRVTEHRARRRLRRSGRRRRARRLGEQLPGFAHEALVDVDAHHPCAAKACGDAGGELSRVAADVEHLLAAEPLLAHRAEPLSEARLAVRCRGYEATLVAEATLCE